MIIMIAAIRVITVARPMIARGLAIIALVFAVAIVPTTAAEDVPAAQESPRHPKPAARALAPREPLYSIDAHIQFGHLSQTARDSFAAILGNSSGQVFGAGAELAFRQGFFVRADVSYFRDEGERVEMVDGEIVPLGIPLTLSLTPIEFSGGYRLSAVRFGRRGQVALVPFVGAGAGVVRFREETDDEHPDEQTSERFTSYHMLVGLDVPLGKRVAIGGELTRRWVRDGLGSGGISEAFGETDLGGTTMWTRVRILF
jgi:opacity protein-like surface antigen